MPNGVICGGAVDGSNQLGEIVTCQATVTWPDGGAAAAVAALSVSATAAMSSRGIRSDVMTALPTGQSYRWQATMRSPTARAAGAWLAQRAVAWGPRGW